ncbi:Solute carrier family 26 member 6 [Nymphon striatum]|nr:Solute carrier family 26 member 6 [Nymphon striatum]
MKHELVRQRLEDRLQETPKILGVMSNITSTSFWGRSNYVNYSRMERDPTDKCENEKTYVSPTMGKLVSPDEEDDDIKEIKIDISREPLNWERYRELSKPKKVSKIGATKKVLAFCSDKCICSSSCWISNLLLRFPVMSWLPSYKFKDWFLADMISGLTVGIMNVPQGMAYAMLASLPPVFGLYTSFYPCLFYFLFGTSKHASVGTFAITSLMTSQVVDQIMLMQPPELMLDSNSTLTGDFNPVRPSKVEIAFTVAFVVGMIQILMGVLRLGNLVVYMSSEMISGFFMACGIYVFTSQIKNLFGLKFTKHTGTGSIIMNYYEFFTHLPETNVAIILISICSIFLLIIVKMFFDKYMHKKIRMPIPIDLLIIIVVTLLSTYCDFKENFGVETIGEIPVGIVMPEVPNFSLISWEMLPLCVSLAFIMFATSVSVGIVVGKKHKYSIDNNQELLALGTACSMSSFFHCFPSSVSMSRSLLTSTTGGKTLISSLFSAMLILTVIVSIGSFFEHLPKCVLSAIIVVALRNIVRELAVLKKTWNISKVDALVWLVSFFVTVLVDIQSGLLTSITFSLILIILKLQWAHTSVLGNIPDTELYVDISKYSAAIKTKGTCVIHFDSCLNFANCQYFKNEVYRLAKLKQISSEMSQKDKNSLLDAPIFSPDDESIHSLILDMTSISSIDCSGINILIQLIEELSEQYISVTIAAPQDPVLTSLLSVKESSVLTTNIIFPSIQDAVLSAKAAKVILNQVSCENAFYDYLADYVLYIMKHP